MCICMSAFDGASPTIDGGLLVLMIAVGSSNYSRLLLASHRLLTLRLSHISHNNIIYAPKVMVLLYLLLSVLKTKDWVIWILSLSQNIEYHFYNLASH